nr:hypothetical protein GCM10020063_071020 [Dactylosporangium thailandense]
MRTRDGGGRQVSGGGYATEGDQVTPTRVTALRIELVQRGAVRTALTVRSPAPPVAKTLLPVAAVRPDAVPAGHGRS